MSNWEYTTLDRLGSLIKGVQKYKPQSDFLLFEGGNIPFLETSDCQNNRLHPNLLIKYYNKLGLLQSKLFKENTVCITNHGRVGDAVILKNPSCLNTHLFGFNSFEKVSDPKFIKYCFNYRKIKELCTRISSAVSSTKELTLDRILKIPFPNPPFELQQKIGKILSTYDLLIENYENQIELLKKQRSKLFQRWFVHHKFPANIDTSPSNWKKLPLKDFVTFKKGQKLSGEAVVDGKYPFFTCSKETQKINEYSFDEEAILLSVSANIFVKYYSGKFDVMKHVLVLIPKRKNNFWLLELLICSCPKLLLKTTGIGLKWLGMSIIKDFEVTLPPDNLLNLFNQFAEPIQKQIDSLSQQMNTFQIIKQELIERIYSQNLSIN